MQRARETGITVAVNEPYQRMSLSAQEQFDQILKRCMIMILLFMA